MSQKISCTLPIRLKSPNVKDRHWSITSKRINDFDLLIKQNLLKGNDIKLPCHIILERQGVKLFDYDNLVTANKPIKDIICSYVLGKKRGVDDDNPGFTWEYRQVKSKKHALHIEITW